MGFIKNLLLVGGLAPLEIIETKKYNDKIDKRVRDYTPHEMTVEEANEADKRKQSTIIRTSMIFTSPTGEKKSVNVRIRRFFGVLKDGTIKDYIFKGKVKAKQIDGSWKTDDIYMFYPEIIDETTGKVLGPNLNGAVIEQGHEYEYESSDGVKYYSYYPMCEVSSGLSDFDIDKQNPNATGYRYGDNLQVEMERLDGNMRLMSTDDATFKAFQDFWERMKNDNLVNEDYWLNNFIRVADYTYGYQMSKVKTISSAELAKLKANLRAQDTAGKSEQAKQGSSIDWEFMKKYNYATYDRLVHGNIAAYDSWTDNVPGIGNPAPRGGMGGMGFGPPAGGPPRRH